MTTKILTGGELELFIKVGVGIGIGIGVDGVSQSTCEKFHPPRIVFPLSHRERTHGGESCMNDGVSHGVTHGVTGTVLS